MDCRKLAERALKEFFGVSKTPLFRAQDAYAFQGFLEGVKNGNITVGQSWVAELFMNQGPGVSDYKEIIKEIFASGMCCQGQQLSALRSANHSR